MAHSASLSNSYGISTSVYHHPSHFNEEHAVVDFHNARSTKIQCPGKKNTKGHEALVLEKTAGEAKSFRLFFKVTVIKENRGMNS